MTVIRDKRNGARGAIIALASLLTIASAGCRRDPAGDAAAAGRGAFVTPYAEITSCSQAVYGGPQTALYANRPYHTVERVDSAAGLTFCRGDRHGTNVWIVEITKPTTLVAFGSEGFGLERRGWVPSGEALLVAAAGVPLDRVYKKQFAPGRYVVRQGFTPTAPILFWDAEAVRLVP